MNDPGYQGLPLTPATAIRLILELFSGKTAHRQDIVDQVVQLHRSRGGDADASSNPTATIKKALSRLKEAGSASNPQFGYWSLTGEPGELDAVASAADSISESVVDEDEELQESAPQSAADKVMGVGKDSVYVYYYPTYRSSAETKGEKVWPCKVGMSERDPIVRILSQGATAMPEAPKVALIIKTDQAYPLEKALHYILVLRGKGAASPGTEWFITNPAEVEEIVRWIIGEV
jgi:hypothetical protein